RRAAVLPDDRVRNRHAGVAVPEERRLALVRDRDRARRLDERLLRGVEDAPPDLLGVVLDEAGLRKVLRQLRITAAANRELLVDEQAGRAGRALVDREDELHRPAS